MNNGRDHFSIIIIPDTQGMVLEHPELYMRLGDSVAERMNTGLVKAVLHVGDLVDDGAADEEQYRTAFKALSPIMSGNTPYLFAIGNHDYDNILAQDRSSAMFNQYFGIDCYAGREWLGGVFEEGKMENAYVLIREAECPLLILSLEFGPRDEVLKWADHIIESNADYNVIIITHCFLHSSGHRTTAADELHPASYYGSRDGNDGQSMWDKSFRKHPNLIAIFSGHHVPENVSVRVDNGAAGQCIAQVFQNWQLEPFGGEGRYRIADFYPREGNLKLSVYNAAAEQYEFEDGFEIIIPVHFKINNRQRKLP